MATSNTESVSIPKELVDLIRSLPAVHFAGGVHPGFGGLAAECSCQNCGCDSRAGGSCGCNERCACQGHTANQFDWAMNVLLGAAAHVPLEEVRTLVELRDRVRASMRKEETKR